MKSLLTSVAVDSRKRGGQKLHHSGIWSDQKNIKFKKCGFGTFFKEFSGEENKDGIARGGQRSKKLCFVIRKNRGCLHSVGKKPEQR